MKKNKKWSYVISTGITLIPKHYLEEKQKAVSRWKKNDIRTNCCSILLEKDRGGDMILAKDRGDDTDQCCQ